MAKSDQFLSQSVIRIVGYGLLVLTLLDLVPALIPLRFTDPVWEFETIGFLVEHLPVPLISIAMIGYGGSADRTTWEKSVLKLLSYLILVCSLVFLLLLPLGLTDSWRIYQRNQAQISQQIARPIAELDTLKTRLLQAKTPEEIKKILAPLDTTGAALPIQNPEAVKTQLLEEIERKRAATIASITASQAEKQQNLLRSALKWNTGLLIGSFLGFHLWIRTRWVRR